MGRNKAKTPREAMDISDDGGGQESGQRILIEEFVQITNAPEHVARHVLEAHGWDVESSVSFYLESGGVGHGFDALGMDGGMLSPKVDKVNQNDSARRKPRSSPLQVVRRKIKKLLMLIITILTDFCSGLRVCR